MADEEQGVEGDKQQSRTETLSRRFEIATNVSSVVSTTPATTVTVPER